jgi:hypothetical protein
MEAAKPDESPGKRKKVTLSGRFPGTSVKQTRLPPSGESRTSHRRQQRKYALDIRLFIFKMAYTLDDFHAHARYGRVEQILQYLNKDSSLLDRKDRVSCSFS